jgi:hypothetical protein
MYGVSQVKSKTHCSSLLYLLPASWWRGASPPWLVGVFPLQRYGTIGCKVWHESVAAVLKLLPSRTACQHLAGMGPPLCSLRIVFCTAVRYEVCAVPRESNHALHWLLSCSHNQHLAGVRPPPVAHRAWRYSQSWQFINRITCTKLSGCTLTTNV